MSLILGIDPGITGAVAWMRDGVLVRVEDLPVAEMKVGTKMRKSLVPALLVELLDDVAIDHVYLEDPNVMPKEGAVGAFAFGKGIGRIEGIVSGLRIPLTLVKPARWKQAMGVPADKGSARARACREWPQFAASFARVKDDGRAESALIGLYGARQP